MAIAGGPWGNGATYKLPAHEDPYESVEAAEQAAAVMTLLRLFPDTPLYRLMTQAYRAMWKRWADMQHASAEYSRQVHICEKAAAIGEQAESPTL